MEFAKVSERTTEVTFGVNYQLSGLWVAGRRLSPPRRQGKRRKGRRKKR